MLLALQVLERFNWQHNYQYCPCDNFVICEIGKNAVRACFAGDENCVYTIHPEPDEAGLELIRNSQ